MTTVSEMRSASISMLNGTAFWANRGIGTTETNTEKVVYTPKIDPYVPYGSGINSLDDFKNACQLQMYREDLSPRNAEIDPNFDYEKEFQKYMESRGCKDEKELQALNGAGFYPTREMLERVTSAKIMDTAEKLRCNGFMASNGVGAIPYAQIQEMLSNMSMEDLCSYGKSPRTGSAFLDSVNDLNDFFKRASKSGAADDAMKKVLEEFMKNIADSYEDIDKFSKKIDEQEKLAVLEEPKIPAYQETEEYQALLIEQYAS